MIHGMRELSLLLAIGALVTGGLTAGLWWDALHPPRAALDCATLAEHPPAGRYRLTETCEAHYEVTRSRYTRHGHMLSSYDHVAQRTFQGREETLRVVRIVTTYPPARKAERSAQRSRSQQMRYAQRHAEDLWPRGRIVDLEYVDTSADAATQNQPHPTLLLRDPPLPLRAETVIALMLTLSFLLGLLFVRYLKHRWTPQPRLF